MYILHFRTIWWLHLRGKLLGKLHANVLSLAENTCQEYKKYLSLGTRKKVLTFRNLKIFALDLGDDMTTTPLDFISPSWFQVSWENILKWRVTCLLAKAQLKAHEQNLGTLTLEIITSKCYFNPRKIFSKRTETFALPINMMISSSDQKYANACGSHALMKEQFLSWRIIVQFLSINHLFSLYSLLYRCNSSISSQKIWCLPFAPRQK